MLINTVNAKLPMKMLTRKRLGSLPYPWNLFVIIDNPHSNSNREHRYHKACNSIPECSTVETPPHRCQCCRHRRCRILPVAISFLFVSWSTEEESFLERHREVTDTGKMRQIWTSERAMNFSSPRRNETNKNDDDDHDDDDDGDNDDRRRVWSSSLSIVEYL